MKSYSEINTREYAATMARDVKPGTVICLDGDLGVGKTVFAKGFAEGLGITEPIVSPTFTIMHGYEDGRLPLYHFDAYRIVEPEEMYELGFDDYLYGEGVCLIEWASQIEEMIPKDAIHVSIVKKPELGDDYREITIS